ncbi:MAG TPA: PASTA domain-containing protein [Candidatus Acidoferrales bacterium]|nr:PASTA domain-containing protein [Candidatus Acidoferrales bacterium]
MDAEARGPAVARALVERLRWLGRLFLLLFVLGSAAFLSAITAMRFAIEGRVVKMPNVVNRSFADAQAALRYNQLGVAVADHVYSSLPVDAVVRQSPPPGTELKLGQRVELVLSLGAQKVTVPNLIDRSLPAARLQLLTAGLQLGEVSYIYASGEPADLILQQDPLPGETGLTSPRVSLLVSLGPRPPAFVMPDLTGLAVSDAQSRLQAAGVGFPSVAFVTTAGAAAGSIVGQNPPTGGRVDRATDVQLNVVSLAPPAAAAPAPVPKLPPKPGGKPGIPYARMTEGL